MSFEEMYRGTPPWDIGQPQPEFVDAELRGEIRGWVLDVGCGTGENSLYLASRGHPTIGIDLAPTALARAGEKARQRGIAVEFLSVDALHLSRLARSFDTVIDSGLFHVFDDDERPLFESGLREVVKPGGTYLLLCFSDREPPGWGPRRISEREIHDTFARGWILRYVRPAVFAARDVGHDVQAWMARLERNPLGDSG